MTVGALRHVIMAVEGDRLSLHVVNVVVLNHRLLSFDCLHDFRLRF